MTKNKLSISRGLSSPDYESIMGTCGISQGTHYWTVRLDHFATEEDIYIGVCRKRKGMSMSTHVSELPSFYGWSPTAARLIMPNGGRENNVFEPCYIGQEVGIQLDFPSKGGRGCLRISADGNVIGTLIDHGIQPGTYYPVVSLFNNRHQEVSVTLNSCPKFNPFSKEGAAAGAPRRR